MGAGKKKPSGKELRRSADAAHFVQVRHRVCICAFVQCSSMSLVHGPMSTTSTNTAAQYHPLHKSSVYVFRPTDFQYERRTHLIWSVLGRLSSLGCFRSPRPLSYHTFSPGSAFLLSVTTFPSSHLFLLNATLMQKSFIGQQCFGERSL